MRKYSVVSVFAGVLALLSLQVRAQSAENIADIRCVIVGLKMAAMADPTQQAAGNTLSFYYIGRLDGRAPTLDIENLIIKEISEMSSSDFGLEAKRCGARLKDKGQEIAKIGNDMNERRQQILDKPVSPRK